MNKIFIITIVVLTMIPSVRAKEPIQHELPIVTHWSNQKNAFEYMASDKPDYRVPLAVQEYRPGDCYYYYKLGNSNFLPDLNHYLGMNICLEKYNDKRASQVADLVFKATGIHLKFYRPDAFTRRNEPTRLEDAPGYVQVLHAKIIKTSDQDPGCLATFFLPPNWKNNAPQGTYPVIAVGHYDLNEHVFGLSQLQSGKGPAIGSMVANSGIQGRTGAIGVIWNGGGAKATYTRNPRAFQQFGRIIDYAAKELGGNRHCVMTTGNSRSGITAVDMASNPLNLDYTVKFVAAGSFAVNRNHRKICFTTTYPKQLPNLCNILGFHDAWKPGWRYPATDGIHVRAEDVNQKALVNTHFIGKSAFEVSDYILSGKEGANPDWSQHSDRFIDGLLKAGTSLFLEVRTNDVLPFFNMLAYVNKLEEKMKEKGDVRAHVDHIMRAGHTARRTSQGDVVMHQKLWEALLQFVDPKARKGPLVEPGKEYYRVNRETLHFDKFELKDGMHPFSMDMPVGIKRGDTITLICTGEPGTTYRVQIIPEKGLDAPGFETQGEIAADTSMRGASFIEIPLDQPIGRYLYRLWIKKPGKGEKELDKSHTITGDEACVVIWDDKKTDNMLSGNDIWKKLYLPLLPRLKPNKVTGVVWGFSEY